MYTADPGQLGALLNNKSHGYVDVVLVCEVKKEEDSWTPDGRVVDYGSFHGYETELLQCNIGDLTRDYKKQQWPQHFSTAVSSASHCSDDIPSLQEMDTEHMLSATTSFGLFSFSSDSSSGVLDPTLTELSSFALYQMEGSSYCCDDLSRESSDEDDYEESSCLLLTKQVQNPKKPFEALEGVAASMLRLLSYTNTYAS